MGGGSEGAEGSCTLPKLLEDELVLVLAMKASIVSTRTIALSNDPVTESGQPQAQHRHANDDVSQPARWQSHETKGDRRHW
jgi:hypothetical protein